MKFKVFSIVLILFIIGKKLDACTTFVISGKYTKDGKSLLFKNRDTNEMNNSLVYFTDGKYKYIGLVDGNQEWSEHVWGGYNEAGFAIINSAAYNNNIGDPSDFKDQEGRIMKLALQTCRTVEDFEKLLNSIPKPSGLDANFGVIDAYQGAAFYETGNYNFVKFDANNPQVSQNGVLIRTNHSLSADPLQGFGFCRFNTATESISNAYINNKIDPEYLFDNLSRNLNHSLTNTNLKENIPLNRNTPEFKFFIDYIPRESTASAIMIVSAKDSKSVEETMMWTILGFPLCSVALPTWIHAGSDLPRSLAMNSDLKSPICKAALQFKDECFPIKHDKGYNYINLSVILNQENTGYLQKIKPIENEIFTRSRLLIAEIEKSGFSKKKVKDFYQWMDNYLEESYRKNFSLELFD